MLRGTPPSFRSGGPQGSSMGQGRKKKIKTRGRGSGRRKARFLGAAKHSASTLLGRESQKRNRQQAAKGVAKKQSSTCLAAWSSTNDHEREKSRHTRTARQRGELRPRDLCKNHTTRGKQETPLEGRKELLAEKQCRELTVGSDGKKKGKGSCAGPSRFAERARNLVT